MLRHEIRSREAIFTKVKTFFQFKHFARYVLAMKSDALRVDNDMAACRCSSRTVLPCQAQGVTAERVSLLGGRQVLGTSLSRDLFLNKLSLHEGVESLSHPMLVRLHHGSLQGRIAP